MLGGNNKILLEIEELLRHMKVDEVITRLTEFEKQDNITKEESHRAKLLRIKLLFDIDKWGEGLDILKKILPECEKEENKLILVDALLLKSIYYTKLGFHDEGIKNSEKGLDVVKKLKASDDVFILREAWFLVYKALNFDFKGNLNIAEEIIKKCLELARKLNDEYLLYECYKFKTGYFWIKGNIQQVFEYYLKMIELVKRMKNDYLIAWSCIYGAECAHMVYRYDLVKKFTEEAEEIMRDGFVAVVPPRLARRSFSSRLSSAFGRRALTAAVTGWVLANRVNADARFPLSDHSDFHDIISYIEAVNPKKIDFVHGNGSLLEEELKRRGF